MPKFLMFTRKSTVAAVLFIFLQIMCGQPALAGYDAELFLHSFDYQVHADAVRIEASLDLSNPLALQTALANGAVIALEIRASLARSRFLLPDVNLSSAQFTWQIRHDALTRDFVLLKHDGETARFRTLPTLLSSALSLLVVDLPLTEPMSDSEKYRLNLSLSLQQINVPDWLERSLLFWQWNEVDSLTFGLDLAPGKAGLD